MRRVKVPKWAQGGAEGLFVTSLSSLLTDAVTSLLPWFGSRRADLLIVVGVLVGSLIRHFTARFIWTGHNA